ncbi:MAG: sulfur transferase domain-containing protein [Pseudomonadota bacterium]
MSAPTEPGQTPGQPVNPPPDHRVETTLTDSRQRRLDRWRRPLVTPWDRLRAWMNMLFIDHGILRLFYVNAHQISLQARRSAQPFPHHIRRFARAGGRTVISLRGGQTFGSLPLEKEACAAAGLTFTNFVLRSRSLPSVEDLRAAKALIETMEKPVLFHCKSGADRAGFFAVLYMVWGEGLSVAEAKAQLSLRYLHIKQGKTGILDAFFDQYMTETAERIPLMEWIETRYDRDAMRARFKPAAWGTLLTEGLLRRE